MLPSWTTLPLWQSNDSDTLPIHYQHRVKKWLFRRNQDMYLQVGAMAD